jgi:hypothetical protein
MKARALIDSASFCPEAVKALRQALDAAWAEIAHHFGDDPVVQESARLSLANAILSGATDTNRNVEALKKAGLARRVAELAEDPTLKRELLLVAADCERLAKRARGDPQGEKVRRPTDESRGSDDISQSRCPWDLRSGARLLFCIRPRICTNVRWLRLHG